MGASYRGGVKETAFSGAFPVVDALIARGADVSVADPFFSDEELDAIGFVPYKSDAHVDAAVVQADHEDYREASAEDLPGVRVVFDGRRVL